MMAGAVRRSGLLAVVMWGVIWLLSDVVALGDEGLLRVMSFNIRYGTAQDGADAWPKRRGFVGDVVRRFQPDLLGTQETLPFQASQLGEDVPGYEYVGWSRDASESGEQCGIFVRAERFEVVESGQFWLSERPEEKFSKSWDSSLPRVATWVKLRERGGQGRRLLFVNTHFDHRGVIARRESAALLVRRVRELSGDWPVIVTGDFNCGEGSEPWQTLTAAPDGLVDSFRVAHVERGESEGTFHGFSGKFGRERIDWILYSGGWGTESAGIDRSEFSGRYPSDHFPVTAVLRWPGSSGAKE
jgi:endonuclease/exonuclease/phosphatase family metal-dependent hydrolase